MSEDEGRAVMRPESERYTTVMRQSLYGAAAGNDYED